MALTKGENLDEIFRIRISASQRDKLDRLANELNVTRSAAVREMIDVAEPSGQPRLLVDVQIGDPEVANAR